MPKFTEIQLMSFTRLNSLDLAKKELIDDDIIDIIRFLDGHPNIKTVNLADNRIGSEGAKEFAEHNKTATSVNLTGNEIGPVGAKEFAEHNKTATSVNLSHNYIGPVGAKEFAEHNKTATSVNLSHNYIGPVGAKEFAEHNKTATSVDLSDNKISSVGAKDFAEHNKTATSVDLSWNQIGPVGAKVLASSRVIQEFTGSYDPEVASILTERNPMTRAMYGREVGMPGEAPSLLRLSLFAVKDSNRINKVMPPAELEGFDHLVGLIGQNII
jgi:Ran GTPase-activating protein (RanGAP) involved in mRNA processing and transport